MDNRQVYDKQHLLCKQSFIGSPISDYNDTYNILYSLCIMPNNYSCGIQYPITQYPIPCGNSWKLSALCPLICLQIIYNHLQNLFDKIIVFQIDLSSIYHSFLYIYNYTMQGVYLHILQYSFYTFCLDVFNTPNISLSFLIYYFPISQSLSPNFFLFP